MISHLAISQAVQDRRIAPVVAQVHRVALIVGNGAYQQSPLANSVNDARDMASLLIHFGFEAELAVDLRQQLLEETIERFLGRVRPGDIALFYYSGHGIQINEQNYLVPIGFDAKDAISAKYNSYPIAQLQERLEASGAALQIVILDACRNNPFLGTRSAGGGLASMTAGRGEYIAFATSPGRTASDNPNGRNGLFTGELLSGLRESNFSLDELFNRVRERVAQKSGGTQIPWSQTSVIGEFHFSSRLTDLAGLSDTPLAKSDEANARDKLNTGDTPKTQSDRRLPTTDALSFDLECWSGLFKGAGGTLYISPQGILYQKGNNPEKIDEKFYISREDFVRIRTSRFLAGAIGEFVVEAKTKRFVCTGPAELIRKKIAERFAPK